MGDRFLFGFESILQLCWGNKSSRNQPQNCLGDPPPESFEAWEWGMGKGKPFPDRLRTNFAAVNHLSPEGWWDYCMLIHMSAYLYILCVQ